MSTLAFRRRPLRRRGGLANARTVSYRPFGPSDCRCGMSDRMMRARRMSFAAWVHGWWAGLSGASTGRRPPWRGCAPGTGGTRKRPATFRDVLASREYRAIYAASTLSWIGDSTARAAVTALVYQSTGSAAASAGAFALTLRALAARRFTAGVAGRALPTPDGHGHLRRRPRAHHGAGRHPRRAAAGGAGPGPARPRSSRRRSTPPARPACRRCSPATGTCSGWPCSPRTNQPAQVVGYLLGSALSIVRTPAGLRCSTRSLRRLGAAGPVRRALARAGA